jgi:hypothetical protein
MAYADIGDGATRTAGATTSTHSRAIDNTIGITIDIAIDIAIDITIVIVIVVDVDIIIRANRDRMTSIDQIVQQHRLVDTVGLNRRGCRWCRHRLFPIYIG